MYWNRIIPLRKPSKSPDLWVFHFFLQKMLVASFLLLASSTSLFTSTFGLTTAASREQPSTLPISSLLHLTTEAASSSQPQEVVIPYGGPMSLPSNLNGILATDPRLRRRNRRRRLRRRGRRRRSRGRRNIQMVSRPWRTTATTSSPMSLYESFGDTQNHVSAYLKIPEGWIPHKGYLIRE